MISAMGATARRSSGQRHIPVDLGRALRLIVDRSGLSPLTFAYVLFIGLAGVAFFGLAVARIDTGVLPAVAILTVLAVLADRISIRIPQGFDLTPSTIVNSAAVFLLPAPGAIVAVFLGALGGDLFNRRPWTRTLFNAGQITIAYAAAAYVWDAASGGVTTAADLYSFVPAAMLAASAAYLCNTVLLSIVLALVRRTGVWRVWLSNHYSGLLPHFGMQIMGILFVGAWLLDFRAVLLLAFPAGLTWMSSRHLRALEDKAKVEQELREKSDALASRWEALAQIGERLSVTVDPKALVETAAQVVVDHCADAACVVSPGTGIASAADPEAPAQLRARLAASVATLDGYVSDGVMALPLSIADRDLGTLYAAWTSGGPTDDQAALLDRVIERIAIALQNAVLSAEASEVEALREVDRMKSDLLASVSHELNTPIALVVGYGELLGQRPPEKEQTRWMGEKILAAGQHLKRMVEDLLDAGRLESGRFALERQSIDLRGVADAALESARAAHPGPHFAAVLPTEPVLVEGDRGRLLQVMTNLLQNAARYGPPNGEVRLVVVSNGVSASVAVEDQGPGVPPGERERIFEKFYRTGAAERKAKKGLGLGLTIARDLTLAHGGTIKVEDAPSGGARFVVELPRAEVKT